MPLIQIKGISGYLSLEQKQEIISKVTDAIVSATAPALLYLLHPCSRRWRAKA
jgi:4-oxalocrotonate tautomerase